MALMKCQGLSPTSWGSGSGAMFCTFAISIMWSLKFAPAQKIAPGVGTGGNSLVPFSGRPSAFFAAVFGLGQHPACGIPVPQHVEHGCVGRAAGCRRQVEKRVVDDQPRPRSVSGLVGCQPVLRHRRWSCLALASFVFAVHKVAHGTIRSYRKVDLAGVPGMTDTSSAQSRPRAIDVHAHIIVPEVYRSEERRVGKERKK